MLVAGEVLVAALVTGAAGEGPTATYVVKLERAAPPKFVVTATWRGATRLVMDTTRPGDLPLLLERGWPALVTGLRVTDSAGRKLEIAENGAEGWRLPGDPSGPVSAHYEVDTELLLEHGWPAPREAVFADGETVSFVGRALFVTTDAVQASAVTFELPAGWRAYAPWDALGAGDGSTFHVRSVPRLQENLIVLARSAPSAIRAAGFRLIAVPMGSWRPLGPEIRRLLQQHARHFVDLMEFRGQESYLAVLLPFRDRGAESYRQSLALTFEDKPSRANRALWANLLGHELFHFWNGWLLQGAEYAPSQWFKEGFTEYAANVSTVAAGFMTPADFRSKLAEHVANYRRLATSLEQPGTHKGPPLYSGGALVAFTWDVSIRQATGGARGLGDFLRALWRRSAGGERSWTPEDLVAALAETADGDWASFLDRHVRGTVPLPLKETLTLAGLRLIESGDGTVEVLEDPEAGARARATWRSIVRGE